MDNYWDSYYQADRINNSYCPSQFATFIQSEYLNEHENNLIIDIGAGNGRDSTFFLQYRHNYIVAVDSSKCGLEILHAACLQKQNLRVIESNICNSELYFKIVEAINSIEELQSTRFRIIIYSRFFLHAINIDEEFCFFKLSTELLDMFSGFIAVEFRTLHDRCGQKTTNKHYRRYIDTSKLLERARKHGFLVDYYIEGYGMAKYKVDDAYVARVVFSKSMEPSSCSISSNAEE